MSTVTFPRLISSGHELETSPDTFGELRSSIDIVNDIEALRQRMADDGYLYLPGYLDRDLVFEARQEIVSQLAEGNALEPGTPPMDAIANVDGTFPGLRANEARTNEPLQRLLYDGRMIAFYEGFLGGEVRHFDYTWLRAVKPGRGTAPHGDSVFMNRGTTNLYTAWVPLGDIDYQLGGLIVLEKSHKIEEIKADYGQMDVDTFCENFPDAELYARGEKWWNGSLSDDPFELRRQLGVRWLSAPFRAGDLLTFTLYTLHASLDNQTNRIRISSDSRYQLASEPVDERWVGENPVGHGAEGKRGKIC